MNTESTVISKAHKFRLAAGIANLLVIGSFILAWTISYHFVGKQRPAETSGSFVRIANKQVATAGPSGFMIATLSLTYPEILRENQTGFVEMAYSVASVLVELLADPSKYTDIAPTPAQSLDGNVSIDLSSSAFSIAPRSTVSKMSGDPLPVRFTWAITPNKEGEHSLLLNIQETLAPKDVLSRSPLVRTDVNVKLNGKTVSADGAGTFKLPVRVTTIYWGLSQRMVTLLGLGAAFLSFILTWDIFLPILKRRLGRPIARRRGGANSPIEPGVGTKNPKECGEIQRDPKEAKETRTSPTEEENK